MLLNEFHEIIGSHHTCASGNCETIVEFRNWDDPDNEAALSSLCIFSDRIFVFETTARALWTNYRLRILTLHAEYAAAGLQDLFYASVRWFTIFYALPARTKSDNSGGRL